MKITEREKVLNELIRTAKNCHFYKETEKNMTHFVNEAGCLRGMMYIADILRVNYPQDEYYEFYIQPASKYMIETEPVMVNDQIAF